MSVRFGKDPLGSAAGAERNRGTIQCFEGRALSPPGLNFVEQHEGEIDQRN
jgi:hypothetical protein